MRDETGDVRYETCDKRQDTENEKKIPKKLNCHF